MEIHYRVQVLRNRCALRIHRQLVLRNTISDSMEELQNSIRVQRTLILFLFVTSLVVVEGLVQEGTIQRPFIKECDASLHIHSYLLSLAIPIFYFASLFIISFLVSSIFCLLFMRLIVLLTRYCMMFFLPLTFIIIAFYTLPTNFNLFYQVPIMKCVTSLSTFFLDISRFENRFLFRNIPTSRKFEGSRPC